MATTFLFIFLCLIYIAISLYFFAIKKNNALNRHLTQTIKKINDKLLNHKQFLFVHNNHKILNALEELLKLMKTTAQILKNWEHKQTKTLSYLQLCSYVDECKQRSTSYFLHFKHISERRTFEGTRVFKTRKGLLRGSCYFCSQPLLFPLFNKSTVTVQENRLSVPSCYTCQCALKESKKINTLYFFHNNQKIHWSEHKSYEPQVNYWEINKITTKNSAKKQTTLKLVSNNKELISKDIL